MTWDITRRSALRGMVGGTAVTIALPILNAALNNNGTAFAAGGALPVRYGTWFWGLGVNPTRWYPDKPGANYVLKEESQVLQKHAAKLNLFGNFAIPLDGAPNFPHQSGGNAIKTGRALSSGGAGLPGESFDVTISDKIGERSRFRSIELSAIPTRTSFTWPIGYDCPPAVQLEGASLCPPVSPASTTWKSTRSSPKKS